MFTKTLTLVLLASVGLVSATPTHVHHKRAAGSSDASLTLSANAVQNGSFVDGGRNGVQADGQTASTTSTNNFINFCSGKTLTNGAQVVAGSCNGIGE